MAYELIIAAVNTDKYLKFQNELSCVKKSFFRKLVLPLVETEFCTMITHYFLSAGTGNKELDKAMHSLLEEGEIVGEFYWHPYRVPLYQNFSIAKTKIDQFTDSYKAFMQTLSIDEQNLYMMDFKGLLKLIDYASEKQLGILHFLAKPMDAERAAKVFYPCNSKENIKY